MAILLRADGSIDGVFPAGGAAAFSLRELQGFVGGYIELVRAPYHARATAAEPSEPLWLVLNEDGKRLALPLNGIATVMLHEAGGALDDYVVGDVLLATTTEVGGHDDGE